eukprot:TRINITY_DN3698_c0_g3_i1.p2 TRINITY_DN3698_c0_g3~~TRINITY_DN3698_c0_g3_i1.p2  ORF type:complete len:107 (-),score=4.57 TRINITY_DN3698_c0_g3_i1:279-599(-)
MQLRENAGDGGRWRALHESAVVTNCGAGVEGAKIGVSSQRERLGSDGSGYGEICDSEEAGLGIWRPCKRPLALMQQRPAGLRARIQGLSPMRWLLVVHQSGLRILG